MKKFLFLLVLLFVFVLNTTESFAQPGRIKNFLGSVDFIDPQHIVCDSGCASPAGTPDDSAFVVDNTNVALIGAAFAEAMLDLTSPVYGAVRMTKERSLHVSFRDTAGNAIGVGGNPMEVTATNFQLTPNGDVPFVTLIMGATTGLSIGDSLGSLNVNCTGGCSTSAAYEMSDNVPNPIAPQEASFGMLWNGSSWDRTPGNLTNGMYVDVRSTVTIPVTGTFFNTAAGSPASTRLSDGAAFYNALKASDTLTKVTTVDFISNPVTVQGTFWSDAAELPGSVRLSTGAAYYNALKASETLAGVTTVGSITNPVAVTGTFFNTAAASPASVRLSDGAAFYNGLKASETLTKVTTVDTITNAVAVTGTFWPTAAGSPASHRLSDGAAFYNALKSTDTLAAVTAVTSITNPVAVTGTFFNTAAGSPASVRLSDGAAFYNGLKSSETLTGVTTVGTVTTITNTVPSNVTQFGSTNVSTGTGAGGAGIPRVTVSNDSNVIVTPPTLTKGTQASTGFSVQNLNDAGRNVTNYFMAAGIAGTNAEVMQSLTGYKGGVAVGATVTPAVVTSGKTYRITEVTLSYQSLATVTALTFRLRANLSGNGVVGSPLVTSWTIGSSAAVAGVTTTQTIPFPDGLEFAAGTGIAVGMIGLSTIGAAAASGFGTISIHGYEY